MSAENAASIELFRRAASIRTPGETLERELKPVRAVAAGRAGPVRMVERQCRRQWAYKALSLRCGVGSMFLNDDTARQRCPDNYDVSFPGCLMGYCEKCPRTRDVPRVRGHLMCQCPNFQDGLALLAACAAAAKPSIVGNSRS